MNKNVANMLKTSSCDTQWQHSMKISARLAQSGSKGELPLPKATFRKKYIVSCRYLRI
jgi:hypothetical protein